MGNVNAYIDIHVTPHLPTQQRRLQSPLSARSKNVQPGQMLSVIYWTFLIVLLAIGARSLVLCLRLRACNKRTHPLLALAMRRSVSAIL